MAAEETGDQCLVQSKRTSGGRLGQSHDRECEECLPVYQQQGPQD